MYRYSGKPIVETFKYFDFILGLPKCGCVSFNNFIMYFVLVRSWPRNFAKLTLLLDSNNTVLIAKIYRMINYIRNCLENRLKTLLPLLIAYSNQFVIIYFRNNMLHNCLILQFFCWYLYKFFFNNILITIPESEHTDILQHKSINIRTQN